jgi:hypothetical protein
MRRFGSITANGNCRPSKPCTVRRLCEKISHGDGPNTVVEGELDIIMSMDRADNTKWHRICGQILQENAVMLKMCRELGFKVVTDTEDPGVCDVTLTL